MWKKVQSLAWSWGHGFHLEKNQTKYKDGHYNNYTPINHAHLYPAVVISVRNDYAQWSPKTGITPW